MFKATLFFVLFVCLRNKPAFKEGLHTSIHQYSEQTLGRCYTGCKGFTSQQIIVLSKWSTTAKDRRPVQGVACLCPEGNPKMDERSSENGWMKNGQSEMTAFI